MIKTIKKTLSLFLVIGVIVSTVPSIFAVEPSAATAEKVVAPLAEQTEWRFRVYNGILQKRLWSITEGKWLTDWIDVGTTV